MKTALDNRPQSESIKYALISVFENVKLSLLINEDCVGGLEIP